jgi:hypothetical protein
VFAKLVLIQAQPAFAGFLSGRPANITQADIARAIRAAKQTGAAEVEVRIGTASVVIRIEPSTTPETALAKLEQISL